MNQRHLWTIVALFLAVSEIPSVGRTQTIKETAPVSQALPVSDVVKVGELQSPAGKQTLDAVITSIHPHNIGGQQAATLFIRNIPVLTFVSSKPVASFNKKVGVVGNGQGVQSSHALISDNSTKVASAENVADISNSSTSLNNDPVSRASLVAAKINQLIRDNVSADKITVSWKGDGESTVTSPAQSKGSSVQQKSGDRYTIKINSQELVEINEVTRLADTTNNLAQDALQATNRLRRLIGKASPLKEISGLPSPVAAPKPKVQQQIAFGGVRIRYTGIASYYGYDGSGNRTASGERFNPEGMTAAHRSLPFNTRVRVTNTRNGRSVVVRITDRGPFIRGRIIDISAGAARLIGMMGSGIAPVHVEVLGR